MLLGNIDGMGKDAGALCDCRQQAPLLAPNGAGVPIPAQPSPGAAAAEMHKAALHDPFAALTGLPPKSSPGSSGAQGREPGRRHSRAG